MEEDVGVASNKAEDGPAQEERLARLAAPKTPESQTGNRSFPVTSLVCALTTSFKLVAGTLWVWRQSQQDLEAAKAELQQVQSKAPDISGQGEELQSIQQKFEESVKQVQALEKE
eukprot:632620-Amphidinium_carterae.1